MKTSSRQPLRAPTATLSLFALLLAGCPGSETTEPQGQPSPADPVAAPTEPPETPAEKPPESEGKAPVDKADLGSISGTVLWDGDLVIVDPFKITKNPEVCGHQDKSSPRLLVDGDTKAVRNAVVWLEGAPKGFETKLDQPPLLDQIKCQYEPHILIARKGSKIHMRSSDGVLHNIHAMGALRFNKPFPLKDTVIKEKARRAGIAELNCDAGHTWMSAFIFVTEHPFYAITGADGRFELQGVPPGDYTLVVWHEGWTVVKTDKQADGLVKRYYFDEPKVLEVKVTVEKKGKVTRIFKLSDKGMVEG